MYVSNKKVVAAIKTIKKKKKKKGDGEEFNYHELLITQNKLTFFEVVQLVKAQHLVQM